MTVFYRGDFALVTHEMYEVRSPVCEFFPIRELKSIHIVKHEVRPFSPGTTWAKIATTALAGIAVSVAIFSWRVIDSADVVVVALLVAAVSSVASAGCWKTSRPPFELWAIFRGTAVCLLRTTDETELGQVSRALLRAVERVGSV